MPRLARVVCPGLPHHLTQRGNNKQVVFHKDQDRKQYIQMLYKFQKDCSCTIHAYCLMNNHIHLLVTPPSKEMLAKMMQKISLTYTQQYNARYKKSGRLWGSRYYSSVVADGQYLWTVSRYIERNPVRAQLVKKPNDYRWSSVYAHQDNINSRLIKPIWSGGTERKKYLKFLNAPDNELDVGRIRQTTINGKPYGSEAFIKAVFCKAGVIFNKRPRGRPKNRDTSDFK